MPKNSHDQGSLALFALCSRKFISRTKNIRLWSLFELYNTFAGMEEGVFWNGDVFLCVCDLIYNGAISCLIRPSMHRGMEEETNGKLHFYSIFITCPHRWCSSSNFNWCRHISPSLIRTNSKQLTHMLKRCLLSMGHMQIFATNVVRRTI